MKKILSVVLLTALLSLALSPKSMAGHRERYRWEGAALAIGGLLILGDRIPPFPRIFGRYHHSHPFFRRHGHYRPFFFEYRYRGNDFRPLGYWRSHQGVLGYPVRKWVPGRETGEGYIPGFWSYNWFGDYASDRNQ